MLAPAFSLISLNLVEFVLFTIHPVMESQAQEIICLVCLSAGALILSELHTHHMFSFWANTYICGELKIFRDSLLYF